MKNATIYLCKADCSILGIITGLKMETCSLKKNATDLWEFSFEVDRYIDNNGMLIQSNYYDSIDEMMKIYFDSNDEQLFFVIDSEPEIHGEGIQETKTITAHSIEIELSHISLKNFKINCGTDDSQEYLATDSEGNFNNIIPYTKSVIKYISFVNYDNTQLSLLHLALQGTGWTVKPDIDPEVCSIQRSYDIQSSNIYSFLMNTVSPSSSIIFEFDRKHRQIGAVKIENFGEDTGVFISMRNLMKSFDVSSSSDDNIRTKIIPSGANNLGIEQVNFGSNYIINLDYFMNTINEYGDYKYVSEELHDKYNLWKTYRETEKVTFNNEQYTRRELYIELTRLYNQTILDINELKNRVPNDGAITDYKTFSLDELKLSLNAYNKALISLKTLYKNDYGADIGEAPDYIPTPSSATNIKDTPYWYDFYAYSEVIIPQIEEALKMYCKTGEHGELLFDEHDGTLIELEFGNPAYYADPSIVKEVDAYKYEWSLYGLDELQSKKKAWSEAANLLFNQCFIKSGTIVSPTSYRTPDDNGWNDLSDEQKKEFTSKTAYIDKLNQYLDYMSFDIRNNSITKTKCKGIIRQCEDEIVKRQTEISTIEQSQNLYNTQRRELSNSVLLENFKINGDFVFTEKDINIIKGLLQEYEYSNDYILTTNLDDIVTALDSQEELYQYATEKLYEISQPQYSFNTEIDNIYALDEFKSHHKPFNIGNFIRVGLEIHEEFHDLNFIKLRIISITYNPVMTDENISVEFSTVTKTLSGMNDIDFLLNKASSGGSSSGGSSSSSGGGTYGNNDANVQLSNNMLNALLSTELFGTTVTDVILDSIKGNKGNFNTLLSHSGIFGSLESGTTTINGDCIHTGSIKSNNYPYTKNEETGEVEKTGSMLDLSDGTFRFAGEKLTWNGDTLSIKGTLNGCDGNFTGSINVNNNFVVDNKGNVTAQGSLKATNAYIKGNIEATNSIITKSVFIDGDIEADTLKVKTTGTIAGWTFDENGFYKNENNIGQQESAYIGNDGISVSDYFVVNDDGMVAKNRIINTQYDVYLNPAGYYSITFDDYFFMDIYINNIHIDDNVAFSLKFIHGNYMSGYIEFYQDFFFNVSDVDKVYGITCNQGTKYEVFTQFKVVLDERTNILYLKIFGTNLNPYNDSGYIINKSLPTSYENSIKFVGITPVYSGTYKDESSEIIKVHYSQTNEELYFQDVSKFYTYDVCMNGTLLNKDELIIDTIRNKIIGGKYNLSSNEFIGYRDYKFCIRNKFESENDIFKLTKDSLYHNGLSTSSSGDNLIISNGNFYKKSSSSKRYKNSIKNLSEKAKLFSHLDPHNLYDIDVVSFRYNDDYLLQTDQRYQKDIPGFIAEDIYEKYPIACNLDKDGNPEMWDINIMFPGVLKLTQEHYEHIQDQYKEIQELHEKTKILQEEIDAIKQQFQV